MKVKLYADDCLNILPTIKDVDIVITDPPYGIIKDGNTAVKGIGKSHKKKRNDCKWDDIDLIPFTKEWFPLVYATLKDDSFMFVFWSQKYFKEGLNIFNPDRVIFWRYNNFTAGGNGNFAYDYDPIFVIKKGNPKLIKGKHSCDLEFTKPQSNFKKDKLVHPTQKPLKLMEHLLTIASKEGDVVLDPFAGGGTTGLAALNLGRKAVLIEKDLKYIDLIKKRLSIEV